MINITFLTPDTLLLSINTLIDLNWALLPSAGCLQHYTTALYCCCRTQNNTLGSGLFSISPGLFIQSIWVSWDCVCMNDFQLCSCSLDQWRWSNWSLSQAETVHEIYFSIRIVSVSYSDTNQTDNTQDNRPEMKVSFFCSSTPTELRRITVRWVLKSVTSISPLRPQVINEPVSCMSQRPDR